MVQWLVALSLDCIWLGFDSHTSPLSKDYLRVASGRHWMPKALLGEFSNGCTLDMSVIEGYLSCIRVQLTGRDHLPSNSLASRAVATIAS